MDRIFDKLMNNMETQVAALLSIGLVASFGAGMIVDQGVQKQALSSQDTSQWEGIYTVKVERDGEVVYKEKEHNLLTTQGQNWIRSQISANDGTPSDTDEAEYISLGNTTAPATGDTVLPGEITQYGLDRKQGSTSTFGAGEFQVQKTYTANLGASQQLVVNTTGLNYGSTDGGNTLISGGEFPDANLLDGDQLTVTHNVTISDGS